MTRRRRLGALASVALTASLALGATACGGPETTPGASSAAHQDAQVRVVDPETAVELIAGGDRTVIDVRTPSEFAAGHVAGAVNIDVSAADFTERVQALDPAAGYLVYCQSGNRSAAAAAALTELGFGDVVDGAAFGALAEAGAPVQTGD